jgi:hypothetical protein
MEGKAWSRSICGIFVLFMMAATDRLLCLQVVEIPLKLAQTAAVMEVVHSALGVVRSPVVCCILLRSP